MKLSRKEFILLSAGGIISTAMPRTVLCDEGQLPELLATAEEKIMQADCRERVLDVIKAYDAVLELDPGNYEALWSLGRYHILAGMVYPEGKPDRDEHYLKSARYSLLGMCTNPQYRKLHDGGVVACDAVCTLTKREIAALYYWFNSKSLIWKESYGMVRKIRNLEIEETEKYLTRMVELDADWGGGHPYFAWAAYYASLPKMLGRDLAKSEEYFNKAEQAGPDWMNIKWARAKLLYTKTKNRAGFEKDLQWVMDTDPAKAASPYPFNVYFQREARNMLREIDRYFK